MHQWHQSLVQTFHYLVYQCCGVSGLSFDSVADIICDLRSKYPHPRFLVIHAGGNDIGKDDNPLRRQQKFIIKELRIIL